MDVKKKIVVLSGAGISAESGINTFRGADGLWEGHDISDVASPEGWERNQALVLDFYNERRRALLKTEPNAAHFALKKLEKEYQVNIITQNIDDLHERAGSTSIIHLHGELKKVRSTFDEALVLDWEGDLNPGDFCEHNFQLRPHVVWFGEPVPMMQKALKLTAAADILIIVGTSMQVYPAAGLVDAVPKDTSIHFIDPDPVLPEDNQIRIYPEKASTGVPKVVDLLLEQA